MAPQFRVIPRLEQRTGRAGRDRDAAHLDDRFHVETVLGDDAQAFLRAQKAPSTRRAYRGDWPRFSDWCAQAGVASLPAPPAVVADYLAHLAKSGKKTSTIDRALAAICFAHRLADQPFDRRQAAVQGTLAGIHRELGVAPVKKHAIEDVQLRRMLAGIPTRTKRDMRERALLLVGWFSACRRSELAALEVSDAVFVDEGLRLTIRHSKTDQTRKGREVGLPYAGAHDLCPVRTLRAYLDATGITEGPLFRDIRAGTVRGGICAATVADIVKRACRKAGLDEADFGAHSLRAGFVTAASKRGKPMESIARQTGHESMQVLKGYIRHATVFIDNAAAGLL